MSVGQRGDSGTPEFFNTVCGMTPSHESAPPDPGRLAPLFSRRSLLAAAAIGAISAGALQGAPAVALATLPYKHPFTEQWFVPNEGEWGNRASWRSYPPHAGVDYNIVGGSAGKTIRAIADGYIRGKGVHPNYGNRVYIEHDDGMWSHYAHMQSPSSKSNGDRVTLGTPIGNVGNTGLSHGAHLHLEMATTASRCHDGNTSIDPIAFINNTPPVGPTDPTAPTTNGIADMTFLCMTPINGSNADAGVYRWIIDPAAGIKRNIDGGEYEYLKTVGYREVAGLQAPITSARYQQIYPAATTP